MENTVGNLKSTIVTEMIDKELDSYPAYPYGKALSNPSLRKTLVTHVLSQLLHQSISIENKQNSLIYSENPPLSPEEEVYLKNLIRQELVYIIQQKGDCISQAGPEEAESCIAPSHWFG